MRTTGIGDGTLPPRPATCCPPRPPLMARRKPEQAQAPLHEVRRMRSLSFACAGSSRRRWQKIFTWALSSHLQEAAGRCPGDSGAPANMIGWRRVSPWAGRTDSCW